MANIWGPPCRKWEANYDVYKLLSTIWYCEYDGSLTILPYMQKVIWRFLDLPLDISKA